jgi:hypothetical protein
MSVFGRRNFCDISRIPSVPIRNCNAEDTTRPKVSVTECKSYAILGVTQVLKNMLG